MADEKKKGDDGGDSTQFQPLHPPGATPPRPPQQESAAPPAEGKDTGEKTRPGGAPPVAPKPPGAPPPPAAAPPSGPAPTETPPRGSPPPAAEAPTAGFDDEGATVILSPSERASCSLQRLAPAGHAEVIQLAQAGYVLGRSRSCDIRLYSDSASRQHAHLTRRGESWYLRPEPGKAVIAAGSTVGEEVRLVHKMRLQLGGDELLFFDEAAVAAPAAPAPERAAPRGRRGWIVALAVVVAALAAAALWMFLQS